MGKAVTTRTAVSFKIQEYPSGEVWLSLEPTEAVEGLPRESFLGLELVPGTTVEQARQLAKRMNETIQNVSLTRFL